jgi:hypothetical protein
MSKRRSAPWPVAMTCLVVLAACGSPASSASGAPVGTTQPTPSPDDGAPVVVGPVPYAPDTIDPSADEGRALVAAEREDQQRVRDLAGFAGIVGSGWPALAESAEAALEAAIRSVSDDLGVEAPIGGLHGQVASAADPRPIQALAPESSAAAMAIVMASLITAQALGSGATTETTRSSTETSSNGDESATMTAKVTGKVVSTGSRVVGDFVVELTGTVTNAVTGATARLTGSASAHVEIDGCPDVNGSSKGRMSLSSREEVASGAAHAGWTRQLSGQFDISVDDEASISGLTMDAEASESVQPSGEDDDGSHDLGVRSHTEFTAGQGFAGFAPNDGATSGEVTSERDATHADLVSLFRSAAQALTVAAVGMGQEAERFWRGGKCLRLTVDPDGGDVDADSVTDAVATVTHTFQGNELDKPVEAALVGVASIDPAGDRQPAPATVQYTAGADDGDVGEVTFKTVSNRGIAERTVTFTVRPAAWDVTFVGTDTEVLGPVSNKFSARITDLRISAKESVLSGTGKLRLKGTVTSGPCSGPLDQVATSTVTGTLIGTGPEAVLRIVIRAASPAGGVVKMRCKPSGGADIAAEGHAERFGEPLMELDLPAAGGTVAVDRKASVGGILVVTVKGSFEVAVATGE